MTKQEQYSFDLGVFRAKDLNGRAYPSLGKTITGIDVIMHSDMLYMKQLRLVMDEKAYWRGYRKELAAIEARKK